MLGTPPAFILSQDQTLMLKWCLCPASFIWHCLLLIRVASRSFSSICLFLNLAIHFSENLGIFRVALLFICQRSVILSLLLFSAATLISYRSCTAYGRVKNIVCGMTERNVCLLRILDGERSQHPEKINKKFLTE